jgi:hypothetical protein
MTDIVERLDRGPTPESDPNLMDDAIAEIKRLRAALAQERKPLTDKQILDALGIDGSDDWTFTVARAVERAHGIGGYKPVPAKPVKEPTRSQKLAEAGFRRRPSLWALTTREALELIATPMRPDGTWNRDREACRQIAAEALGRYDDE